MSDFFMTIIEILPPLLGTLLMCGFGVIMIEKREDIHDTLMGILLLAIAFGLLINTFLAIQILTESIK